MAFNKINFAKISSSLNNAVPRMWSYLTTTDTLEDVKVSGYFNDVISEITENDLIYINASDSAELFHFGPFIGNDILISNPTLNTISLQREFTCSGAALESFTLVVPASGTIIGGTLGVPDGTGAGQSYTFNLVRAGGTIGSINIPALSGNGSQFSFIASPVFQITKGDLLFWENQINSANPVTIVSSVLLNVS